MPVGLCRRIGTRRAVVLSVVGAVLAGSAVAFLTGASPAQAITSIEDGTGFPGETVTVRLRNDTANPAFTTWAVVAAPQTRIVTAQSANPPGTGAFPCQVLDAGARVQCGPSGAGGWAAGNIVSMTVAIDTAATAGAETGTSSMPNESGSYTVIVLPPPAPVITAPADGSEGLDRQPVVSGTKRAGNSASVVDAGDPLCAVPADAATTWSCSPTVPLSYGTHPLTATQTSPGGDTSSLSAPVVVTVLEPAELSVTQDGPSSVIAGRTVEHRVSVAGGGPGVAVRVTGGLASGVLTLSDCRAAGILVDCGELTAGTVQLGDLGDGSAADLTMSLTAAADTPPTVVDLRGEQASPVFDTAALTVTGLPAPTVATPAPASTTSAVRPRLAGLGDPLSAVTVSTADTLCSDVPVRPDGSWSCRPALPIAYGPVVLTASQRDHRRTSLQVRPRGRDLGTPATCDARRRTSGGGDPAGPRLVGRPSSGA